MPPGGGNGFSFECGPFAGGRLLVRGHGSLIGFLKMNFVGERFECWDLDFK